MKQQDEVFTQEELEKMNRDLQKNERAELPSALSRNAIEDAIKTVPQQTEPAAEQAPVSGKKRANRRALRAIAGLAAAAVAITTVGVMKPWAKPPKPKVIPGDVRTAGDYSEIENLFAGYREQYVKSQKSGSSFGRLGSYFGVVEKTADMAVAENAASAPASQAGAADGVRAVTGAAPTDNAGASDDYGRTNEQVAGVSEADILKNDGRYLYVADRENRYNYYYQTFRDLNPATADSPETITEFNLPALYPSAAVTILQPQKDGSLKKVATVTPTVKQGDNYVSLYVEEMYVNGNTMTVLFDADICHGAHKEEYYPYYYGPVYNGAVVGDDVEYAVTPDELEETTEAATEAVTDATEPGTEAETDPVVTDVTVAVTEETTEAITEEPTEEPSVEEPTEIEEPETEAPAEYTYYYAPDVKSVTLEITYDISDRANPKELGRVWQDGYYVSSRMVGNQLILISNYGVALYDSNIKENCVPVCRTDDAESARVPAGNICLTDPVEQSRYLVASTVDVTDTATLKTEAVLGAGDNVYCTTETLYATTDADTDSDYDLLFDGRSVGTQIFKFDVRGGDIRFLKSATVRGWSLDQFSMDEYNGNLRIATTTGYWGENTESQIYVLDANLDTLGILPHVGKGETIRAVRFMGNTAYVVTFEQTDPLFVIDLSDPANPTLKGEVKLPGFSSYLHPVGDGLLLGIGYGGDEDGTDGTLKVSLFDVSDPTAPREAANYITGDEYDWVNSPAQYDHKAVCWDEKTLTLYLPVTAENYSWSENGDSYYGSDAMIYALRVDPQAKTLTKTATYTVPHVTDCWRTLERCTWIGGTVYGVTFNDSTVFAFNRATGDYIGAYSFATASPANDLYYKPY